MQNIYLSFLVMIKFDIDDPEQERLLALIDGVLLELRKKGATDEQILARTLLETMEKEMKGELLFPKEKILECLANMLQQDKLK